MWQMMIQVVREMTKTLLALMAFIFAVNLYLQIQAQDLIWAGLSAVVSTSWSGLLIAAYLLAERVLAIRLAEGTKT